MGRIVRWKLPAGRIGTSEESPITQFGKAFSAFWQGNSLLYWNARISSKDNSLKWRAYQTNLHFGRIIAGPSLSGASNGAFGTCSAGHSTRTTFATPCWTLPQRTHSMNSLARSCFRRTVISITLDLLCDWLRLMRMLSRVINPATRTIIRLQIRPRQTSSGQRAQGRKNSRSSLRLRRRLRNRNLGLHFSTSTQMQPNHTYKPSALLSG
jgi:hypothetical protein